MSENIIVFITMAITIVPLIVLSYYINEASNKGIYFGVRIPLEYQQSKEINELEKYYKKLVTNVAVIPIIIFLIIILFFINNINEVILSIIMTIFIFVIIGLTAIPYIICYKKLKKIKLEKGWTVKNCNVIFAETTLRCPKKGDKDKPINPRYYWWLLIFPIFSLILTMITYNNIPDKFIMPGSSLGVIEKGTLSGMIKLLELPLTQIFMAVLFIFIGYKIIDSKSDLKSGSIEVAIIRKKKFKKLNSIWIFITAIEVEIMCFLTYALGISGINVENITIIMSAIISITMLVFLYKAFKIGQGGRRIEASDEKDELFKDDDENWILGSFYYNKKDPSFMVEKRVGIGWTVNVANPWGMLIIIGTLVLVIGTLIYSIVTVI